MIQNQNAADAKYLETDLIVTDPPYNIGYKYAGDYHDNMTQEEYRQLFVPMIGHRVVIIHYIESIIEDIVPILGTPQRCAAWTYPSNAGNRQWRSVVWWNCRPNWKNDIVPYKNLNDKRVQELLKTRKGRTMTDHWDVNLVKNVSAEKVKGYTNQIPEQIISRIIKTTANVGDTIVDPFAGTGTTPAVAQKLGFKWRAYDTNTLAIKLANDRVNKPTLFQRINESATDL